MATQNSQKSFWEKPEGKTGALFLIGIAGLIAYAVFSIGIGAIMNFAFSLVGGIVLFGVLGLLLFMALDSRNRNLISYMYQSVMRKITGIFVTIDPIGILKNYVHDMEKNLKKLGKQIGEIKGQMRKLKTIVTQNNTDIEKNMAIAKQAKKLGDEKQLILNSRKAARLKESNGKYVALHKKLSVLYRVLSKMYTNSEILLEDTKDQVRVKEQEAKAIKASHSAMKSAMSIIKGDPDKRAMFDQAMTHIADDVANKVGEMEQFMEMSSDFMNSIDLQNGLFEEKGLKMLEEYEKKSTLMLLGGAEDAEEILELDNRELDVEVRKASESDDYDSLFE
jgi:phage shock protein A